MTLGQLKHLMQCICDEENDGIIAYRKDGEIFEIKLDDLLLIHKADHFLLPHEIKQITEQSVTEVIL